MARHLMDAPDGFANRLADAFASLLVDDRKEPMIEVVGDILHLAGGPLTEGFVAHKATE